MKFRPTILYSSGKLTYSIYADGNYDLAQFSNKNLFINENIFSVKVKLNKQDKKELSLIMKKYDILNWYEYEYYSSGKENYLNMNSFYCLNSLKNAKYLGMTKVEYMYRTNFEMWFNLIDYEKFNIYKSDGLPDNYNLFSNELWDFVIEKTNTPDWRICLEDISRQNWMQQYPTIANHTPGEIDLTNILYFSLTEVYSENDNTSIKSITLDSTESYKSGNFDDFLEDVKLDSGVYSTEVIPDIYYTDLLGNNNLYQSSNIIENSQSNKTQKLQDKIKFDVEKQRKLMELFDKFGILNWEITDDYVDNNIEICNYRVFIYLYDKEGKKLKLSYSNEELPDNYIDFNNELYDLVIGD